MTKHIDSFAPETKHAKQERESAFSPFNSAATDDSVISHPGDGRDEIELHKPLLVAMARENSSVSEGSGSGGELAVDAIFDEAVCDVAELALQTAGLAESPGGVHKLRALMLRVIRDLDSYKQLADHVSQYSSDEIEQFGLHTDYGQSTYRKAAGELDSSEFKSLVEASFIAVHALFWNGVPIPDAVKDQYDLSHDLGPAASDFPEGGRNLALYNLVEDLLQIVVSNLDFRRNSNKSRDIRSLVGIFAHAAYTNESIENYDLTAQHSFDLSSAFTGGTIRKHIDDLTLWQIEEMFDEINQRLLEYILESGVVSQPVMISYDLTDMQSLGLEEFDDAFLTEDGRWRFASLSFTDSDLEFSFGLRLLKSESQRAGVLRSFLRNLTSMVDVKLFMADRGFDGQEDIEACQTFVPGCWIIHAQDPSDDSGRSEDFARLREKIDPNKTATVAHAGYENLHPPVQMIGYSGAGENAETPEPIRAFYTDISLPADEEKRETEITNTNFRYNQRSKIESMFRMGKNKFDVATDTDKKGRKSFYINMSVLFYNLYNIVNTVPAPKCGVEFNTTQKELLEVVQNLAFGGIMRPDALDYHLQDES